MSRPTEVEGGLGKEPISIEEKVLKLDPTTIITGVYSLLKERMYPLMDKCVQSELTEEEDWRLQAYWAVNSLVDASSFIDGSAAGVDGHRQVVGTTLKYMRFLGFSAAQLSAEGIVAESDKLELDAMRESGIEIGDSKITSLDSKRIRPVPLATTIYDPAYQELQREYRRSLARNRVLEAKMYRVLGIDLAREDQQFLNLLEDLTMQYKEFPTYKQFRKDSKGAERLWRAVMFGK